MADFKEILINSKKHGTFKVLIDEKDFKLISELKLSVTPRKKGVFYVQDNKRRLIHRLITSCPEGFEVDHINRNTLDNRRENLRIVTKSENLKNRASYSNTGYKFLYYDTTSKERAPRYHVKFPGCKRKSYININDAKAYYIECLIGGE